ncbi:MAG: GtrA family protein [Hyphomonas sp.]|uniref:GtrA family protein n=1 Tax=Hyphomonas sp. TaxID=87 RepID=UPI003528FFAC
MISGDSLGAQIARFGLVGIAATAVHATVAFSLTFTTSLNQLLINTIAFLVAFCFSGAGHTLYTFRVQENHAGAVAKWFVISVAGLCIGNAIIFAGMNWAGLSRAIAQGAAIFGTVVFSFFGSRLWAFRQGQEQGGVE